MSILERILASKVKEIARGKAVCPLGEMMAKARDTAPARGFLRALESPPENTSIALIAEIKRASPSRGLIRTGFDPATLAKACEDGGAACLSVLTDKAYFQGADSFLGQARAACTLPVLRKDFIIDPWQVAQSRTLGADCILLIITALERAQAQELIGHGRALGMDVLVEVHNEAELETALALKARLVGVNNRDLRSFEKSLGVTEALVPRLPAAVLAVSESGIGTAADVAIVKAAGARAILVGESLMRQPDVCRAAARLLA